MKLQEIIEDNKFLVLDDKDIEILEKNLKFLKKEGFGLKKFEDFFEFEKDGIKTALEEIQNYYGKGYKKMIADYLNISYSKVLYQTTLFGNYSITQTESYQTIVLDFLQKHPNKHFTIMQIRNALKIPIDHTTMTRLMTKFKEVKQDFNCFCWQEVGEFEQSNNHL